MGHIKQHSLRIKHHVHHVCAAATVCVYCVYSVSDDVSLCFVRDASDSVKIWRHVHPQSFHLPICQLLFISSLYRILQRQVRTASANHNKYHKSIKLENERKKGQNFIFMSLLRFVGYPGNYNTLFGVRNEDVSQLHNADDGEWWKEQWTNRYYKEIPFLLTCVFVNKSRKIGPLFVVYASTIYIYYLHNFNLNWPNT